MEHPDDLTRHEGLYRQLAERLQSEIEAGHYGPDTPLPSETQLTERYRVSRQTVRKAISLLQATGLVEVEQGRGTFVRRPPILLSFSRYSPEKRRPGRGPFEQTCADLGIDGYGELISVEHMTADDNLAAHLQLPTGAPIVHRRRHMHAGPTIVQIQDGYFDSNLVLGTPLADSDKLIHGTYAALEAIGQTPTTITETLSARMPTNSESSILKLRPGVPVINIHRLTFSDHDRILEYLQVIAAADKNIFTYNRLQVRP